jgi:hypothetical protein
VPGNNATTIALAATTSAPVNPSTSTWVHLLNSRLPVYCYQKTFTLETGAPLWPDWN